MTIEEKARRYDEAKARMSKAYNSNRCTIGFMNEIFPELKKSNDEIIREEIIDFLSLPHPQFVGKRDHEEWIAWLEKQGEQNDSDVKDYNSIDPHFAKPIDKVEHVNTELVKQGKQEQLYIRFGGIPTDEKSKIYRGEIEVGTENGVSVYPAFKTDEGDIVLGLTLPITKTTLYTQQHLLEYDNRPCYLVSGDYVGKGTDGEPLIKNISVIKRLDNYRIKECEKKPAIEMITSEESLGIDSETYNKIVDECIYGDDKQKPADKVEPKFKVGEWYVDKQDGTILRITKVLGNTYKYITNTGGEYYCSHYSLEQDTRLWTIQDAKPGDVLHCWIDGDDYILIFKQIKDGWIETYGHYYDAVDRFCVPSQLFCRDYKGTFYPATKEQRDLLFQKMKEADYEWDAEKKELKEVKDESYIMGKTGSYTTSTK